MRVADIPSIFGSTKNSKILLSRFKKLLIFFTKSFMSSILKALDKESIGRKCFIFLNLFKGSVPISWSIEPYFFKNEYFLSKSFTFFFKLSYSESVIFGSSKAK